jgi:hypothetical protein
MSGGLLLHRIRGAKPGRTVGVTAHALAVRARPWIPRPPAPAAFASAHLPEHSFSQAPGPGPRSAKIIRNGGYRVVVMGSTDPLEGRHRGSLRSLWLTAHSATKLVRSDGFLIGSITAIQFAHGTFLSHKSVVINR